LSNGGITSYGTLDGGDGTDTCVDAWRDDAWVSCEVTQ
jgi:hypothetical protein